MKWTTLLSTRRLDHDEPEEMNPARSPFQKDQDRIVFSSAFRCLQDKTQVHSQPDSDYVRTRLTHSMEVASVGRSLGTLVGAHVVGHHDVPDGMTPAEFGHIVSAACLAHDIGNPPFGHFGERAIRDWFRRSELGRSLTATLSPAERADLESFEGNAQGFRVLTRLQHWADRGGLQLTCATLGAYSKYPRAAHLEVDVPDGDAGAQKFGFLQAEADIFAEVAETLGLLRRGKDAYAWCRHPLAYLVEAADDTCYQIVDLEDAFKLGRLSFKETETLLLELAGDDLHRYRSIDAEMHRIAYLRAKAVGRLVYLASDVFISHEEELLAGTFGGELLERSEVADQLRHIARITRERVFESADRREMELSGSIAINALLRAYLSALLQYEVHHRGGEPPSHQSEALMALFPSADMPFDDRYQWLLRAVDHVAGMTDSHALARSVRVARVNHW